MKLHDSGWRRELDRLTGVSRSRPLEPLALDVDEPGISSVRVVSGIPDFNAGALEHRFELPGEAAVFLGKWVSNAVRAQLSSEIARGVESKVSNTSSASSGEVNSPG